MLGQHSGGLFAQLELCEPLAAEVGSDFLVECDVSDEAAMDETFRQIKEKWGKLDFLVHAIGFSNKEELEGRYIETGHPNEVLASAAFANANQLKPGSTISAVINGKWEKLQIVGLALSPEYVYEIRGGEMFPDNRRSGVLWMSREALGPIFNMKGAFNDVVLTLAPAASEAEVIRQLDDVLANYGGLGAYNRDDQVSHHFLSNEIAELQVTGTFIPATAREPTHLHYDVRFLLIAAPGQEIARSDESLELRWFPIGSDDPLGGEASLLRMAQRAREWLLLHPPPSL